MKNRTAPLNSLAAFLLLLLFVVGCNLTSNNEKASNSNANNSNASNSNANAAKGGNSNGGARNTSDGAGANGNSAGANNAGSGGDSGGGGGESGGSNAGSSGAGGGSSRQGGGGGGAGSTVSVTIINEANYDIFRLFMSPTREQNWGPDQLGDQIIRKNGGQYTLRNIPCDNYDIRLVDEDNDECVMRNVSFCGEDRIWRITNDELLSCQARSRR